MARTYLAGEAAVKLLPNAGNFHHQALADIKKGGALNAPVNLVADAKGFRENARQRLKTGPEITHKIRLVADTTGFRTEAQRKVDLGRNLTAKVKLTIDRSGLSTEIAAIKTILASTNFKIKVGIDLDTATARADIARLTRDRTMKINLRVDNRTFIDQSITYIFNDIDNAVTNVNGGLGKMFRLARPAMYALAALAAVDMIPLLGVLTKAVGVLGLVPAVAGAAGAALGTMLVGSTGIMDAFKAVSKVSDAKLADPGKTAQQVAAAQNRIASAERQLGRAQKDSLKAQKDLNDERKMAVRRLRDMNDAVDMSVFDEEDAAIAIERAKINLRDVYTNGGTALDERQARSDLGRAMESYEQLIKSNGDLRSDTDAANKAGVEGDAQVVAAKDAVVDAQERILEAQENVNESMDSFNEKVDQSTTEVDELAKAMANLSPNAQDFVNKIKGLGGMWQQFRMGVQDNLFAGLGDSVVSLANTYMPILETGFGKIATAINGGVLRFFEKLQTIGAQDNFSKIFENTSLAIGPFIDGISLLLEGLGNLAAVGSEFLPGLSEDFKGTMQEFSDWSGSEEGKNQFREFLTEALDAFRQVKDLFLAIGGVIGGLFATSEKTGKSMIESLTDNLNEFSQWMKDNPDKMQQFWTDVRNTVNDVIKMIEVAITLADKVQKIVDKVYNPDSFTGGTGGAALSLLNGDPVGAAKSFGGMGSEGFSYFGKMLGVPMLGNGDQNLTAGALGLGARGWSNIWNWGKGLFGEGAEGVQERMPGGYGTGGGGIGSIGGRGRGAGSMTEEEFNRLLEQRTGKDGTGNFLLDLPLIKDNFDRAKEMFSDLKDSGVLSWDGLSTKIGDVIDDITGGKFTRLKEGLTQLGKDILGTTDDGKINWGGLGTKIGDVTTEILDKIFPGFKTGLQGVKDFASAIVAGFKGDWDQLKDFAAQPINWIIDNVINGALKSAWNTVAKVLGLDEWDGVARIESTDAGKGGGVKPLAGMWTGGVVPGYTPGRDPYVMGVSGGEGVIRPEATQALGKDWIDGVNTAARRGGKDGAKRYIGGYAMGGIVQAGAEITSPIQQAMWDAVRTAFPMAQLTSGTRYEDVGSGFDNHMGQRAIDLAGPMTEIARWIYQLNQKQPVLELIHAPLDGWENLKNGAPLNYGAGTDADHFDHVHWAMDSMVGNDGKIVSMGGGSAVGRAGGGMISAARAAAASAFQSAVSGIGNSIPDFGSSLIGQIPKAMFDKVTGAMSAKIAGSTGGGSVAGPGVAGTGPVMEQVKAEFAKYGWDKDPYWSAMDWIIGKESSWNPTARNPNGGAFGLFQFLGSTKDQYLPDENPNPGIQGAAGARYVKDRYGDPLAAKAFWEQNGWYDQGGIANGIGVMGKNTLEPERVLSPEQTRAFEAMLPFLMKLWNVKSSDDPLAVNIEQLKGKDFPTTADTKNREVIEGSAYGQDLQGAAIDKNTGEYLPENNTPGSTYGPTVAQPLPPAFSTTNEGKLAMSLAGMGGELGFGAQAAKLQSKEDAVMQIMQGIATAGAAAAGGPQAFAAHLASTQGAAAAQIGKNFAAYLPEAAGGMLESAASMIMGPFAGATINTGMSKDQVREIAEDGMNRQMRRQNPRRR